jgi:hypothetical protein
MKMGPIQNHAVQLVSEYMPIAIKSNAGIVIATSHK